VRVGEYPTNYDQDETSNFEYATLAAISMPTQFSLGTFIPGSGSPTTETATSVEHKGNIRLDVRLRTQNDFSCPGSTIGKGALKFSDAPGGYGSKTSIATTYTNITGFNLGRSVNTSTPSSKSIYWQFLTTQPISAGTCSLQDIEIGALYG